VGAFLITACAATVAVVAAALVVITGRPGSSPDPLGIALAQVSTGKAGASLVLARQQVIQEDAATASFSVTSVPKASTVPPPAAPLVLEPAPDPGSAQAIAYGLLASYGFSTDQWGCLDDLWQEESGWRYNAENPSGAYGIPQALPGSKMASAGPDWQTDPTTQINWGLGYIKNQYGTPCNAWAHEQADGWY
jgi:Transglycosylase SLT domain